MPPEPAAEEIAFVPGGPGRVFADEQADEEIELDVGSGSVEVEGLAHVVLGSVVGRAAPIYVRAAAVDGVAGDGFKAAFDEKRGDALADKAVVVRPRNRAVSCWVLLCI